VDVESAQTPALILNLDALERNLRLMASETTMAGIRLRPHSKTHKSPWVAARQIQLGAVGICTAKVGEAEVMVKAGISDVLVTTEVVPQNIARALSLATMATITLVVDDSRTATEVGRQATAQGLEIPVLVDVNVGQNRTGTEPGQAAVDLAMLIADTPGLRFAGLQGYEGHLQHRFALEDRRAAALACYQQLADTQLKLREAGLESPWITTAGTGTYKFALEHGVASELQPGSYVVMDSQYAKVERTPFENALFVMSGVVSTNRPNLLIVDAGYKSISTDDGNPSVRNEPTATYQPAGDEYGRIAGLSGTHKPGDRVWLVPSHCDTTINLHDSYLLVRDDGRIEGELPIAARGKSS
jgi:D-serine deaminase-like pyridoxal phosphate-dependent protein